MSRLRAARENEVVLVTASDLHFCPTPPPARAEEKDWHKAMLRPLKEVAGLMEEHHCPLVVAGDVFDKWNPPVELVNWVLKHLPRPCFGVPGNHDLPNHKLDLIHKSGFWNLVQAGAVTYLEPGKPVQLQDTNVRLWGFPLGWEVTPCPEPHDLLLEIAIIHAFIWKEGKTHPGAEESSHVRQWRKKCQNYDVAVFGDNHQGFLSKKGDERPILLNNGGFYRRRTDEVDHRPSVGLIYANGEVKRHYLNTVRDKLTAATGDNKGSLADFSDLMGELAKLGEQAVDFAAKLRQAAGSQDTDVKEMVERWLRQPRDR